eukprot:CAMPEP_0170464156 /NCGR_PEP_ID=MMETSP0123-20130129/8996_1 /TAXON_ID=182087 /ORGANISM="Favella ehrenbergii, Strain Fehren 1" /LENGTH=205 /DNA_ID=CAMNT_0010729763 /DNA_START=635 /DNA_END=1252 /DNA_ORIENTATION=-
MVSSSRQFLDAKITDVAHVRESMFKSSVTYYTIETKSTLLGLYSKNKTYTVQRRFNDFKRLHSALRSVEQYRGFSIAPLPEESNGLTSYVVHSDTFIKERRQKLDSFLRLLTAHEVIRFDELLCRFLTQPSFDDDNLADPYLYGKFKKMVGSLPNTTGLSLDLDSLNTLLSFQLGSALSGSSQDNLTAGHQNEVDELKPTQMVVT